MAPHSLALASTACCAEEEKPVALTKAEETLVEIRGLLAGQRAVARV